MKGCTNENNHTAFGKYFFPQSHPSSIFGIYGFILLQQIPIFEHLSQTNCMYDKALLFRFEGKRNLPKAHKKTQA
jgi:hypothetical protein